MRLDCRESTLVTVFLISFYSKNSGRYSAPKYTGVFGTPCIIYTVVVQTFSEPSLSACGVQTSIDSTVLKDFTECNLSWTRYVIREFQDTVHDFINLLLLTARRYASAVYAVVVCPCVRLSVCLTQAGIVSKPLNIERHMISPGNLVFWSQRYPRNSTSVKPYGGAKCSWGGSKSATFDK